MEKKSWSMVNGEKTDPRLVKSRKSQIQRWLARKGRWWVRHCITCMYYISLPSPGKAMMVPTHHSPEHSQAVPEVATPTAEHSTGNAASQGTSIAPYRVS